MNPELLRRVDLTASYDKKFVIVFRIWLQFLNIYVILLTCKFRTLLCKSFVDYMVSRSTRVRNTTIKHENLLCCYNGLIKLRSAVKSSVNYMYCLNWICSATFSPHPYNNTYNLCTTKATTILILRFKLCHTVGMKLRIIGFN